MKSAKSKVIDRAKQCISALKNYFALSEKTKKALACLHYASMPVLMLTSIVVAGNKIVEVLNAWILGRENPTYIASAALLAICVCYPACSETIMYRKKAISINDKYNGSPAKSYEKIVGYFKKPKFRVFLFRVLPIYVFSMYVWFSINIYWITEAP